VEDGTEVEPEGHGVPMLPFKIAQAYGKPTSGEGARRPGSEEGARPTRSRLAREAVM
jgi:hypothetical protein